MKKITVNVIVRNVIVDVVAIVRELVLLGQHESEIVTHNFMSVNVIVRE